MEAPTQEELTAAIETAGSLPKLDPETLPPEEQEDAKFYFGNNFYMLFKALMHKNAGQKSSLIHSYLERAEAFGDAWQKFLTENQTLLEEIEAVLKDREIYSNIMAIFKRLCFTCPEDIADEFDQNARLDEIEISLIARLNPLLKQAAAAMVALGIEAKQFNG